MKKIVERIKEIVFRPRETWETIKTEETTIANLFTSYLLLFAAIPALASLFGKMLIGYRLPIIKPVTLKFWQSFFISLFLYLFLIGLVWLIGKIIVLLAPKFESKTDAVTGMKLAVFIFIPFMAAGILYLIPTLSMLVFLAGLYGFYLLYVGLPVLMETPKEKVFNYFLVLSAIILVLVIIVNAIMRIIHNIFGPSIYIG